MDSYMHVSCMHRRRAQHRRRAEMLTHVIAELAHRLARQPPHVRRIDMIRMSHATTQLGSLPCRYCHDTTEWPMCSHPPCSPPSIMRPTHCRAGQRAACRRPSYPCCLQARFPDVKHLSHTMCMHEAYAILVARAPLLVACLPLGPATALPYMHGRVG